MIRESWKAACSSCTLIQVGPRRRPNRRADLDTIFGPGGALAAFDGCYWYSGLRLSSTTLRTDPEGQAPGSSTLVPVRTWQCPFGAGYEPSHRRAVTGSRSRAYYKIPHSSMCSR